MYLYLLVNEDNSKFYIGITDNLERRLGEHNYPNKHFTGKISGDWKLLKYKWFDDEARARIEEKRLKKCRNKKYIAWYFNQ